MINCPYCGQPRRDSAAPTDNVTVTEQEAQLNAQLWFGKYRGKRVSQVLKENPGYLLWAHENVDDVNLHPDILKEAKRLDEPRQENRRILNSYNRSWGSSPGYDDDEDDDIPF